jgi:hypothetical protein
MARAAGGFALLRRRRGRTADSRRSDGSGLIVRASDEKACQAQQVTSQRWLNIGLSLALLAVIGVGAWQVLTTRSQLRHTQYEAQSLARRLTQAQSDEKATNFALAVAQRKLNSESVTSTTTLLPAPFPFVDNTTLLADLNEASENGFGNNLNGDNPAWITAFVNAFTAEEERETVLAEQGETYYIPDPISEANAYVANGTLP